MKPLSVNPGVFIAVVGLALFGCADVWGEDWKLFRKTEDAKFYYDKQEVTHLSQKMVKVWIRQVYTKKGKMDMIKLVGPRYESLSYSINSLEYDCLGKMVQFLSMTYYSKDGHVLDLENPPDRWEPIRENSMLRYYSKRYVNKCFPPFWIDRRPGPSFTQEKLTGQCNCDK